MQLVRSGISGGQLDRSFVAKNAPQDDKTGVLRDGFLFFRMSLDALLSQEL